MQQVLLVLHLLIAIAMVGTILLQKSEGGGLGIGGGGGMSGFMTGRGTANLLTRTTAILAALFFITSLALAWLVSGTRQPTSILDMAPAQTQPAPEPGPTVPGTDSPAATTTPPATESQPPAASTTPAPAPEAPPSGTEPPTAPAEPSVPTGQ